MKSGGLISLILFLGNISSGPSTSRRPTHRFNIISLWAFWTNEAPQIKLEITVFMNVSNFSTVESPLPTHSP